MKITSTITAVFVMFLLQACSLVPTQANKVEPENSKNKQLNSQNNTDLTAPEIQIIREMVRSGCLIEQVELNRRKQDMHITCAKEYVMDSSEI